MNTIEVRGLTKRYRSAVDALGFDVRPGAVTGFPGLNGAGKSTAKRMILGLDRVACAVPDPNLLRSPRGGAHLPITASET
jgi:ABC-type Mn2+/Zn2+ transport system ATPase subunit